MYYTSEEENYRKYGIVILESYDESLRTTVYNYRKPTPSERKEIILNYIIDNSGTPIKVNYLSSKLVVIDRTIQKTIKGILLGYDIKRKTFTFKEINGECMQGKLGKDFDLIKTLEIPTNYEANITITDMHDIENDKHKYAYELLHLRALEE